MMGPSAAKDSVELAEGDIDAALATVRQGLALDASDAARVALLDVKGDALRRRDDLAAAEMAHHRHALESWLDLVGEHGDVRDALEVTQRILGRNLLDQLHQREIGAGDRWSIARVGERAAVLDLLAAYRRAIDDPAVAQGLGEMLFPRSTLPGRTIR